MNSENNELEGNSVLMEAVTRKDRKIEVLEAELARTKEKLQIAEGALEDIHQMGIPGQETEQLSVIAKVSKSNDDVGRVAAITLVARSALQQIRGETQQIKSGEGLNGGGPLPWPPNWEQDK